MRRFVLMTRNASMNVPVLGGARPRRSRSCNIRADAGWTGRREAVGGSVVSKRAFSISMRSLTRTSREFASELLDRRKVPLK